MLDATNQVTLEKLALFISAAAQCLCSLPYSSEHNRSNSPNTSHYLVVIEM